MRGRFRTLFKILLIPVILAGCAAPHKAPPAKPPQVAAAGAPQFDVTLWSGQVLRGPVRWQLDGTVIVGEKSVRSADVRLVQSAVEGARFAGGVDVSKLPANYRPLSADALADYRKRCDQAADLYKGSDAVLCLDQGENVYHKDGTQSYLYHALYLILKDSARGLANVSLGFHEGRSRTRVLFARSIAPDGASRWAEADTFAVSVPPQAQEFVDTRSRVLSGQVPGADTGMFVEYVYEDETYNPEIKEFFFPGYTFQSERPVLDSVIDVLVPSGTPLNFATRNMPESARAPERFVREGFDGYRWEMHDVPPITPEPFMPADADVLASMQGSLYFDWKSLMAPTGRFQKERIEDTPAIKKLAEEITAGKTTDDEKVAAVYQWVERNVNYLSVKSSLSSGWAGHPASETLKNGYGDCTDVSIVAASLCRAVGVDAYPAIIKTNDEGTMMTEIPVPDANHAITLVYPNGKPRFIDATAQDYRYPYFRADDHGAKAIIDIKEEITDVPVGAPEDNMRESAQKVTLLPNGGATFVEQNSYTGTYEAGVRGYWRSVPPELRARIMQQYLQSRAPGALLDDFKLGDMEDLSKQFAMEIDYRLPSLATLMQDLYIFTLPGFGQNFPDATLDKRTYDIVMPTTLEFVTTATIALPDGYELAGVPEPLKVEGKYLFLDGTIEKSADGRTLIVKQVFKRLTNRVPVADYSEYRKDAARIAAWTELKIVLRKTAPAAGEVRQ